MFQTEYYVEQFIIKKAAYFIIRISLSRVHNGAQYRQGGVGGRYSRRGVGVQAARLRGEQRVVRQARRRCSARRQLLPLVQRRQPANRHLHNQRLTLLTLAGPCGMYRLRYMLPVLGGVRMA